MLFLGGGTNEKGRAWGAELWNRGDESWTDAGRFAQPRTRHAATRLADGRVLVVGGEGEPAQPASSMPPSMSAPRGPVLRSVELWDPKRLMFQTARSMREARIDPAAVRLADGRVLVTGGNSNGSRKSALKTAEVWSPTTAAWASVAPMEHARAAHTMTLLGDGRVLVLGGDVTDTYSIAELYDPVKNAWTTLGELPEVWTSDAGIASARLLHAGR